MKKGLRYKDLEQNEFYKDLLSGRIVFISFYEENSEAQQDGSLQYFYTIEAEYYNKVTGRIETYTPSPYTLEKL